LYFLISLHCRLPDSRWTREAETTTYHHNTVASIPLHKMEAELLTSALNPMCQNLENKTLIFATTHEGTASLLHHL
jgi:hypothetical protein